ncbi:MAG: hypothetical protein ABI091_26535 [Ferruginibacter sp.]
MRKIIFFSSIIVGSILLSITISCGVISLRDNYNKPDTTLIYKNGKWDTTIVIKQVPVWLR